jgi:hypothetical protein
MLVITALFRFDIFQTDPATCTQARTRLLDPAQKSWIVFQPGFVCDFWTRNFVYSGFAYSASHDSTSSIKAS